MPQLSGVEAAGHSGPDGKPRDFFGVAPLVVQFFLSIHRYSSSRSFRAMGQSPKANAKKTYTFTIGISIRNPRHKRYPAFRKIITQGGISVHAVRTNSMVLNSGNPNPADSSIFTSGSHDVCIRSCIRSTISFSVGAVWAMCEKTKTRQHSGCRVQSLTETVGLGVKRSSLVCPDLLP